MPHSLLDQPLGGMPVAQDVAQDVAQVVAKIGAFPEFLDSTQLAAFRSCPRRFYLQYLMHWKPKEESIHLVAGKAFAAGLEASRRAFFEQHLPSDEAQAVGIMALVQSYGDFQGDPSSPKSLDRVIQALEFYFDQYPFDLDGTSPSLIGDRLGIEFRFCEPLDGENLPDCINPDTGNPLLYTGRADLIAEFADGRYVFDEKTTSSLGALWARQWDLRSQFSGYVWAGRRLGIAVNGVIVRGISILKTKFDTQQVISYRQPWEIERWEKQLNRDVLRMQYCYKTGWWDYALDHACTEYSGCIFRQICKTENPDTWLPVYFEQRVWNPLTGDEAQPIGG